MLLNYAAIIGRAAWVRDKCGFMNAEPPYSTRHVFNTCFPRIAVSGTELPHAISEMAVYEKGGRALYYNRRLAHPIQRVGLMHGLYHHWTDLKGENGLRECNLNIVALQKYEQRDPVEISCDLFAAEILVPFEVLDGYAPDQLYSRDANTKSAIEDEIDHLASRFNVPRGFVKWRLWDLEKMRRTHFNPTI